MEKEYDGKRLLICANVRNETAKVKFSVNCGECLTIKKITEVFEERDITTSGEDFEDTFSPYGTHVYEITGTAKPKAVALVEPQSGDKSVEFFFYSSQSYDPQRIIEQWHWDFGDGYSTTTANAGHTYDSAGTYAATLTITYEGGLTDTDTIQLTVRSSDGGMVGHWTLDEVEGTIAADSSGKGNHGILQGGLSFDSNIVSGPYSSALEFDGIDDYIDCGKDSSLLFNGDEEGLTISLWMKIYKWPESYAYLVSRNYTDYAFSTGTSDGFFLFWKNDGHGGYEVFSFNANNLNYGGWNHILITFDRNSKTITGYCNGVLHKIQGAGSPMLYKDDNATLTIAKKRTGVWFEGAIDDVRIYNRALPEWEIIKLYENQSTYELHINNGAGDGIYPDYKLVKLFAYTPPAGKEFDKWTGDTINIVDIYAANTYLTMPASDISIAATYKGLPVYTLTVENGSGSGNYEKYSVFEIAADAAPPDTVFDRWKGDTRYLDNSRSSTTRVTILADSINLKATFKPIEYKLTVNRGSGDGSYTKDAVIEISAYPAPGDSVFNRWTGDTLYLDNAYSSTTNVTMPSKDISLTASYKVALYRLTVNHGRGDGSYEKYTVVEISANAAPPDSVFDRWIGYINCLDNPDSSITNVTMPSEDITFTATYKPVEYSLTVNRGNGDGTYEKGTIVKIYADIAPLDSVFKQWKGDTAYIGDPEASSAIVTMPAKNITLIATYDKVTGMNWWQLKSTRLFPNPVTDELYLSVDIPIKKIEVINIGGISVIQKKYNGQKNIQLNMEEIESGYYFLEIFCNDGSRIIKNFIKH
ncbi:LamG-like jellyroll fold domain-containing protein [Bacteroidota bacterium]